MPVMAILACAVLAVSQEEKKLSKEEEPQEAPKNLRFFEREPYDELHVREKENRIGIHRIRPLQLKGDKLPELPTTEVEISFLDRPAQEKYKIQRGKITQWIRFRELVLLEAERLVTERQFDEAFIYYKHLRGKYRDNLPQLDASIARFHAEEAKMHQEKRQPAQALALLNSAHELNPQHPGLADAMAEAVDVLIQGHVAAQKYDPARTLLVGLKTKFPKHAAVAKWEGRLSAEAQKLLTESKDHASAGRMHEARETALASVRIWPLEEATKLLDEAQRRSPRLVVGVTAPAQSFDPERLDDWAARRSGRLLHRTLAEFAGHGPQGGQYRSPLALEINQENLGQQLVLHLNPKLTWSDGTPLTGADVSRHLLAMADPLDRRSYRPDWAELFAAVRVRDGYEVQIDLRRTHVHPEGLLQTVLLPWRSHSQANQPQPALGPYSVHQMAAGEVRYRASERYFAPGAAQPKEIIERYYDDGRKASTALRNGEIAMLDRVSPWEIDNLQAIPYLHVEPYAVPTVHCLIPNSKNKLLTWRTLRRAILVGIHREKVLTELLQGARLPGNRPISGPFPAGLDATDPIGYAYDYSLAPRPYDRALSVTLVALAIEQENTARKKRKEAELTELPPLVLLHPGHDVARVACRQIKTQLEPAGIKITLKEQTPAALAEGAWDLRYAELAMVDPVIDGPRLLGASGMAARPSSFLALALRELERANDWKSASQKLLEIHRLTYEELPVIPLWQLTDHFAYHRQLQGVAARPVSLYSNVEQWQSPPAVLKLSQ
jgi:ABC-type transport system substrate-binding protein